MPRVRGGTNAQASSACRVIGRVRTIFRIVSLNAVFEATSRAVREARVRQRASVASSGAGAGAGAVTRRTPIRSTPSSRGSQSTGAPSVLSRSDSVR